MKTLSGVKRSHSPAERPSSSGFLTRSILLSTRMSRWRRSTCEAIIRSTSPPTPPAASITGRREGGGGGEVGGRRLGRLGGRPLFGDVGLPQAKDKALSGFHPAIEEQCPDQRLDHVADDIVAFGGAVLARLLAEPDQGRDANLAPILGARDAIDETVVALREIAFRLRGVALVQGRGDHQSEHPVAEELQPLIAVTADARVGQRQLEQRWIVRIVAELVSDKNGSLGLHSATPA